MAQPGEQAGDQLTSVGGQSLCCLLIEAFFILASFPAQHLCLSHLFQVLVLPSLIVLVSLSAGVFICSCYLEELLRIPRTGYCN